jgi:hypothetical protein
MVSLKELKDAKNDYISLVTSNNLPMVASFKHFYGILLFRVMGEEGKTINPRTWM